MKIFLVCAFAALSGIGPCRAGVVVRQTNGANVFGYVQAGRGPSRLDVTQEGAHNIAGVIQVSPNAAVELRQMGTSNSAAVVQGSPGRGFWGGMP